MTVMTGMRGKTLEYLREMAAEVFAKQPKLQSLMMTVAQYWNDEADDAVHAHVVASERRTPLWPHVCHDTDEEDALDEPAPGELCEYCSDQLGYLPFDDNGWAIESFQAYCYEDGSQDESMQQNYRPFAVARRSLAAGGEIEVEVIGTLLRPELQLLDGETREDAAARARPFDARAAALFEIACASPDDDGPRRVLADYLLERDDTRGDYISLALADRLDQESATRRDAFLEQDRWSWIHPLEHVVPNDGAVFERGLLTHVDVYAAEQADADAVRGAAAWASVQTIRLHGTCDVLDPAMRSLREIGPLRGPSLQTLAAGPAWSIRSLHVVLDGQDQIDALARTTTLPALRRLTLSLWNPFDGQLGRLREAAWWPQLESLTLARMANSTEDLGDLAPDLPRVAIAETDDEGRGPLGWCFTLDRARNRVEVTLAGFTPTSTRVQLVELVARSIDVPTVLVGNHLWQPTEQDVEMISRFRPGISIA